MNPAGSIVGDFCNQTACPTGFIRAPSGSFTKIDFPIPGCAPSLVNSGVIGINPGGTAVGSGGCYKPPFGAGFVRAPNGAMTIFNPPGSEYTSPFAINPAGAVTGYFCDGSGCHGFLRDPRGAITAFDPPSSFFTFATDINSAGAIIGSYYDANGAHGFLRLP